MNQYHCETCEHLHVTDKGMPPDCEKTNHWLTESDRKLMKEVGCASHSSIQSNQDKISKIYERYKHLDVIIFDNKDAIECATISGIHDLGARKPLPLGEGGIAPNIKGDHLLYIQ